MNVDRAEGYGCRMADAAASMAMDGVDVTAEEEALFAYLTQLRMSSAERLRYVEAYLAGKVCPPES
jgi:hypothetical protein